MFFSKKKKQKIDPKIRFQNRQFNQKLQQARTFKRISKPIPDSAFEKLLDSFGLGGRLAQIGVGLLVLGILYFVYAPNFLTLQNITVEGLSDADRNLVEASIRDSIANTPFYNPQRNLLFLSSARINEATFAIPSVFKIDKISRDYKTKSLKVVVQAKHERFLVRSLDKVFDIYNDGTIKGLAGLDRNAWETTQNPNMAKIDITATIPASDSRQFISPETTQYLTQLQEELKGIVGSSLAYYSLSMPEITPVKSDLPTIEEQIAELEADRKAEGKDEQPLVEEEEEKEVEAPEAEPAPVQEITLPINLSELNIVMQKGTDPNRTFRVIVDTKENARDLVLRLNLLLSQTAPDRYNNLSYIDLRIQSRAYVCLLNTACTD
jgi:hypothetical protein